MATILLRHVLRTVNSKISMNFERLASSNRVKPRKLKKPKQASSSLSTGQRFESVCNSVSSRGYLRPYKPYAPTENAAAEVLKVATSFNISKDGKLSLEQKFNLLNGCYEAFNHSVPNSQLHEINSLDAVIRFYETPVDTKTPLDAIQLMDDLPENLHIQYDYVRFNPETDTMFNGVSAFPKSSTMVTGLKYKDKYPGYVAKKSWP